MIIGRIRGGVVGRMEGDGIGVLVSRLFSWVIGFLSLGIEYSFVFIAF